MLYAYYSGQLFVLAVALFAVVAIADLAGWLKKRPLANRAAGFLGLFAIALAILSGPPMSLPLAIVISTAAVAYMVAGFGKRRLLGVMALLATTIATAVELPYHLRRSRVPLPSRIIVIGDSLASGGFGEQRPWPAVIEQRMKIRVTNLALASSDVTMALERQLLPPPADRRECVIVEIGGNDMLEGVDIRRFAASLDGILAGSGGRNVVMLELPLLPGRWSYGAVQRKAVKKHRCTLVPKRVLARVLLGDGNTFDGIHLTQRGHDALAGELLRWLEWRQP